MKPTPAKTGAKPLPWICRTAFFLFDESLIITPVATYTWIEDRLGEVFSAWGNAWDRKSRSADYLSPQIGLVCGPLDWLNVKSNLAKYARYHSFYELSGDHGLVVGNPDLKEEK